MAQHGFAQIEAEMRRQDGTRIWVMMSGRPLNSKAVLDESIWIYTDITERRLAESEQRIAAAAFESPTADAMYIRFNNNPIVNTVEQEGLIIDYDGDGYMVGMEIAGASYVIESPLQVDYHYVTQETPENQK
jgi:uncharacterized protein YuzE